MEPVSSSSDLPTRVVDLEGSRLSYSKSKVSSSELPVNVPHLLIEKSYLEDDDFFFAKSSIECGSSIAGLLHICDDDSMMVALGMSSKLSPRQPIAKQDLGNVERGKYFCIWNTTPVKINSEKRRTTVKYPLVFLFRDFETDTESYRNIYSEQQYQSWFPLLLPHAIRLMGDNVDDFFRNTLDNTLAAFGTLKILHGQFFLSNLTSDENPICRFRVTITKEPLESDPIRIIPILRKGSCTGVQCQDYVSNSGLFVFDEWLLKWPAS